MKCQHCGEREANVNLLMQFNNQKQQLQLCHTCYNEMKNTSKNPAGFANNGGTMDDFFKNIFGGGAQSGFQAGANHQTQAGGNGRGRGGLLDSIGKNLTDGARAGLIDPVIGREQEVKRVIETLNRRNKNNPVLIGEPGVGKTAIAEGLALQIVEGNVPVKLQNKEIYLLDVASLVANTGVRGQFEEKMKQLISELQQRKNVILFVDEIHLLVGAGTAEGSQMDAGNILKPALARGELQLIGATTLKEYRQIEKDAALERRFQPVMVKEPTTEQAIEILEGLQEKYEAYHQVTYSADAIKASVNLSQRYIQDRFLPDKAIDLLDEAGSRINLLTVTTDEDAIQTRLAQIAKEKEEAAGREDYERAAYLRQEEIQLEQKLEEPKNEEKGEVTVEVIQQIVEEKTGIPVTKIQSEEQNKMKNLAANLSSKVIGQKQAVERVAKAIRRSRAGLKSKQRPIGSFLFVGPTGVGKTELTKALAEEMFGTRESFIRLDMSEYMERHSVAKLIGSPPGYVGHEEAGQLTERVRRNPYTIVLLDEIEKAHPDVQHMFLQIMEDGHLTDSQGRKVSFKDTVIIMTSNAGTGDKQISVGFTNSSNEAVSVMEKLGAYFKPEFLNRFDSIISFEALKEEDLVQIVELMLTDLTKNMEEEGYQLEVTDAAKHFLAKKGYDPRFGARPLRRVIQGQVEDKITDFILEEEDVSNMIVDLVDEQITVVSK
ncbi:ATP-dependent Clp protease ATP-binding subunit ClpE [Terribacillus halophilus]|uniref:ATP-dependent Clp protease ATP-binding subunit ClpE n=1 Tax=Terribacillus halophilus TaxID=361279 RepID=A0A1G6TV62_9BACI|nr:ATP-dependent Clp protease ATP-binding subunit [Terribacillus halophilus]SDD32973.1 ATP-dependent Clp protease ATP-binding subunit ClpE [Terribacillus halophilus]